MTTLKETLSELSALAPEIPAEVEKVQAASTTLQDRVTDLIADLAARGAAAASLAGGLATTLDALRTDASGHRDRVEEAVSAGEGATDETRSTFERATADLAAATDDAEREAAELTAELAGAAARGREGWERAAATLDALGQTVQAGRDESQAAVDAALAGAAALAEAAHEVEEQVTAAGDALTARIDDLLARGKERLARLLERVQSQVEDYAQTLEDGTAHLEERCTALAADLGERLEALVASAAAGAKLVSGALGTVREAADAAQRTCGSAHEHLAEQTADLAAAVEPLPAGIDAVKAAAERVGMSWS